MMNDKAEATLQNEKETEEVKPAQSKASTFTDAEASVNRSAEQFNNLVAISNQINTILSGTNIDITVDAPYNGQSNGFANGTSCVTATVEFIRSDGFFLTDEPIVVEKPDEISISGNTENTGSGSLRWCVTANTPITAQIIVKLKNFPQTQASFNVNFTADFNINNRTDTTAFIFNRPITFTAQIQPWTQRGLKEAKLVYTSATTDMAFNTGLPPLVYETGMTCSTSGICTATVPECVTLRSINASGAFVYTFKFIDQTGNIWQQSYNGTLQLID